MSRRGFTLIEVLVALAIGAFGIVVAATIARWAARQSGQGRQGVELQSRLRVVGNQLRVDLGLAGLGTTGAIAAQCTPGATLDVLCVNVGTTRAIPAIRGANNLPSVGTGALDETDAVQIVVPDPSSAVRTTAPSLAGQRTIAAPGIRCPQPFLYAIDSGAPNGAGRAQLFSLAVTDQAGATSIDVPDALLFNLDAGSDVMCARISTWWVDPNGWLRRSDFRPGRTATPVGAGFARISIPAPLDEDLISPGVADLQIAYAFSSEIVPRTGDEWTRWAFSVLDPARPRYELRDDTDWFETRQVRVSLLMRTARAVEDRDPATAGPAETVFEDRATPVQIPIQYGRQPLTVSAVLTNLRYFDQNAPQGLAAGPL